MIFSKRHLSENQGSTRLSKETYLTFASWLKNNIQENDLQSDLIQKGTLLSGVYEYDLKQDRIFWLKALKETPGKEIYRTLGFMRRKHGTSGQALRKEDQDSMFEIPVYYQEDFYDLLLLRGLSPEQATKFTLISAEGAYKRYCRNAPKDKRLDSVSQELHDFAKMAGVLPSRNWIKEVFRHEYLRYKEEKDQKEAPDASGQ